MRVLLVGLVALTLAAPAAAESLPERAARYLRDLVRLDTTNPPGNETRAAQYLRRVMAEEGIECEVLGGDASRQNFIARVRGTGAHRPLLLMAHSDVVPAEVEHWSVPPFSGDLRDGFYFGRGTIDDKSLLAAELAVLVEYKRSGTQPSRDIILLSEADEEAGSTGIQWLVAHAWTKIDAEFAINEGGFAVDLPSGTRLFHIQTSEKIPTRMIIRARGTAGHGSLPRGDNPVVRLARAVVRLAEADQPVRLNTTTRRYLNELSKLPEYAWLAPMLPRLHRAVTAIPTANHIRERDTELDTQLRTTIVPTVFQAGTKVNVIPSTAELQVDIRRLPNETREEILARVRRIINDTQIEVEPAPGQEMPPTEPSSTSTALYKAMESVFRQTSPKSVVLPYMQRGATDGAFLRQKGMAVYGIPLFLREDRENRAHGNDERISAANLAAGTELLRKVVEAVVK